VPGLRIVVATAVVGGLLSAGLTACGSKPPATSAAPATCSPRLASLGAVTGASPLPDGEPVGRGVLIYGPAAGGVAWLVTQSGTVYTVPALGPRRGSTPTPTPTEPIPPAPPPPPVDPMFGLRLSPDGRWLVRIGPGYTTIRDLTGDRVLTLPPSDLGAWSDDGRWLAVTYPSGRTMNLTDLDTGEKIPVRLDQAHALWQLNAIFGPHEVLLQRYIAHGDENPSPAKEYATIDPTDGRVLHQYTVDFDGPGAAGHLIAWTTESHFSTIHDPREIIVASLDTGHITARLPLPATDPGISWFAERAAGDTVVLTRTPRSGDPSAPDDPVQLFNLDPVTGTRQLTCTLPSRSTVILPS
jgi:hypothetical protein